MKDPSLNERTQKPMKGNSEEHFLKIYSASKTLEVKNKMDIL